MHFLDKEPAPEGKSIYGTIVRLVEKPFQNLLQAREDFGCTTPTEQEIGTTAYEMVVRFSPANRKADYVKATMASDLKSIAEELKRKELEDTEIPTTIFIRSWLGGHLQQWGFAITGRTKLAVNHPWVIKTAIQLVILAKTPRPRIREWFLGEMDTKAFIKRFAPN